MFRYNISMAKTNSEMLQAFVSEVKAGPSTKLVSPVGGPHSLRGVGRGDGGGREQ